MAGCSKSFVAEADRVLVHDSLEYAACLAQGAKPLTLEMTGPRSQIYFDPSKVHCAIATCGGLCPGTNDVIRAIVLELYHIYGVRRIYGCVTAFRGLSPSTATTWWTSLPRRWPTSIFGGMVLSTSRVPRTPARPWTP